ncbi:MAG: hypothetical protein HY854_25495 [Burkholderiales bacterium]|nr:hypothetical protein [Burkholderiales bacterium]
MKQLKTLAAVAAALLVSGGAFAQAAGSSSAPSANAGTPNVTSASGAGVTSGTGMEVSQGTAPATIATPAGTAVMGVGPAPTTIATTSARTWPEMPPNVESRKDFQRWLKLR